MTVPAPVPITDPTDPAVDDPRKSLASIHATISAVDQRLTRLMERADNMAAALAETQAAVKALAAGHKPTFWDW